MDVCVCMLCVYMYECMYITKYGKCSRCSGHAHSIVSPAHVIASTVLLHFTDGELLTFSHWLIIEGPLDGGGRDANSRAGEGH